MDHFVSINGIRATTAMVHVPMTGPWYADVDLDSDTQLSGAATIKIGDFSLKGRIDPTFSGTFHLLSKYRVVGGAHGWAKKVTPKQHHNDGGDGVRLTAILKDVAIAAGETLNIHSEVGGFVGKDFIREAQCASRILRQVLPEGVTWWVDFDGVTHVGKRVIKPLAGVVEVLDYDARDHTLVVSADDPSDVDIGTTFVDRLAEPLVVREMEISVAKGKFRIDCWCCEQNGFGVVESRLGRALRTFVQEVIPRDTFSGRFRYRVVDMSGTRALLQAVKKKAGLPDILPVSIYPGVSGAATELTPGTVVIVEFIENNPALPIVTHFAPEGEAGFQPVSMTLYASDTIMLAAGSTGVSGITAEHATSIEAVINLLNNVLLQIAAQAATVPLIGTNATAILNAAIAASAVPLTGDISPYLSAIIAALTAKLPNLTGTLPGVGWPSVEGG